MAENTKTPAIRFAGFTDAWEQRKLGEFGKATSGTSIESEFTENGKYKVISIGSYSETSKYIDQGIRTTRTKKTEKRILNKNDLTMILNDKTTLGNIIGRVLLINADDAYVYNQRTERIEVYKKDYLPEFLYQLLNADNIRLKIIRASQGNTQIYVNWSSISELVYEIPMSKEEQIKIAEYFDTLDNLITLHQCKCEKLINVKKSMLEKMFPKNSSNVPEIRFKGFTEAWEQRKLEEIIKKGGSGGTPSALRTDYYGGNIPFLAISDIKNRDITAIEKSLTEAGLKNSAAWIVPTGSISLAMYASVGKVGILSMNSATSQAFFNMIFDNSILRNFVYYRLVKADLNLEWEPLISTGTQRNLNAEKVKQFKIIIPHGEELKKIGDFLWKLDNLITLHQCKLKKLQNIKKSMLEKMFI